MAKIGRKEPGTRGANDQRRTRDEKRYWEGVEMRKREDRGRERRLRFVPGGSDDGGGSDGRMVFSGRGRGVVEFVTSWLGARKCRAGRTAVGVFAETILLFVSPGENDTLPRLQSALGEKRAERNDGRRPLDPFSGRWMGGGRSRSAVVKYYPAGPFQNEFNPRCW